MVTVFMKPASYADDAAWITQLQTWLTQALADQAQGKTITQAGSGDVNTTKLMLVTPQRRIEELIEALAYYDTENDYSDFLPVKRTSAVFV